jgi:predicted nucleotidyltransferase component of viral defense system
MLSSALIRQYANGARVSPEVAGQDIALHYALALLNERGLIGRPPGGGTPGPLLFKGGTALRKCVFGSLGRFSEDIDLDAERKNGFEAEIEELFQGEYHGLRFHFANIRYSEEENFSGTVEFAHEHGQGTFELQISYRMTILLPTVDLPLAPAPYQSRVECGIPLLHGLDPYEMIAEKIMACSRRLKGSGKDVYDLGLWASRPFGETLVRRLAVLKAWTDRRRGNPYHPEALLAAIVPGNFRWTDLKGLVPRNQTDRIAEQAKICTTVRSRFASLAQLEPDEEALLADQTSHREVSLFEQLSEEARAMRCHLG